MDKRITQVLERGVEQVIDKQDLLKQLKSNKELRVKLGIDPTGPNIHIGRAIQLWKLRAFQELGHKIVLIIGDFTALVGDASDKTSMRKAMTEKQIKQNMKTYISQVSKILDIKKTEIRYNSEWLNKLSLKDYINMAMKFTAQQMIQRRNFKERWDKGNPIGAHELVYPIMQGYDSVAIKADVEIGGSDQLFNLKTGREIQKMFKQKPQNIMTLKMLYGLDGRKMSTTWNNVVNINDSPQEMFGKIMSMKDELIPDYFELATRLPLIKKIKNPREEKARLAREIVSLYHGKNKAKKAEQEFNKVFKHKQLPSKIQEYKTSKKQIPILDLLYDSKLVKSKTQAKRLILEKGVKIDNKLKLNWKEKVKIRNGMIIKIGKRKFRKICLKKS